MSLIVTLHTTQEEKLVCRGKFFPPLSKQKKAFLIWATCALEAAEDSVRGLFFPSLGLGIGLRSDFCSKCLSPLSHLTSPSLPFTPSLRLDFTAVQRWPTALCEIFRSWYVCVHRSAERLWTVPWQPIPLFSKLVLWRRPPLCSRWPHTYLCVRNYVRNEGFCFPQFPYLLVMMTAYSKASHVQPEEPSGDLPSLIGLFLLWYTVSSVFVHSFLYSELCSITEQGTEPWFVNLNPVVSSPQQIPPEPVGSRPESC